MTTIVNWSQVMFSGVDTVGIDMNPIENYNQIMAIFFIFFMIFGSFFLTNLFVGVVINKFNQEKEKYGMNFLLTPA